MQGKLQAPDIRMTSNMCLSPAGLTSIVRVQAAAKGTPTDACTLRHMRTRFEKLGQPTQPWRKASCSRTLHCRRTHSVAFTRVLAALLRMQAVNDSETWAFELGDSWRGDLQGAGVQLVPRSSCPGFQHGFCSPRGLIMFSVRSSV